LFTNKLLLARAKTDNLQIINPIARAQNTPAQNSFKTRRKRHPSSSVSPQFSARAHDTLGNRHRTVNLDSNYDLTIEYTDADESTGGPLSILPQWDLTSEQGILFIAIPIGAVVLYAGSIALRSKRKWKYSYL